MGNLTPAANGLLDMKVAMGETSDWQEGSPTKEKDSSRIQ